MTRTRSKLPPFVGSLSARLLILTIAFVMLAEVLIFSPSVGRFRLSYLEGRLAAGHLAILALEATPDLMVDETLEEELLDHVGAYVVGMRDPAANRKLMLMTGSPGEIDAAFDLREAGFFTLIGDALSTMAQSENRVLRVVGQSPEDPAVTMELVLDEAPLRQEMISFGYRILGLSLFISAITAALVFLSLHLMLVRPMRRMTENMVAFSADPEDASRIIAASARGDEIGLAERQLQDMQRALRASLHHKTRLAALGTAVTKINHDLRNILSTASLVSDRLAASDDPKVRQAAPTLIAAIDRAARLCGQTLNFTREGPAELMLETFDLAELVEEVGGGLPGAVGEQSLWLNAVSPGLRIEADREQLHRVLTNLAQNALQAGATRIEVTARMASDTVEIEVVDNGPGLAPRAREHLFQPFTGSTRADGTGLGLAIVRDLVRAHGGEISLRRSDAKGTSFLIVLPRRQSAAPASAAQ